MAVTAKLYGPAMLSFANKEIDWEGDAVKAMLCTGVYTPDQDTHRYKSSVTNEVTGSGYTAGGIAVPGRVASYTTSGNVLKLTCDTFTFTALTVAGIRKVVFYIDTGSDATSPLVCYQDLGADYAPTVQDFKVNIPLAGLITQTAA